MSSEKNIALTFGTFDKTHDGHKYYLSSAKKYGNKLVTIVATDRNVEKIKGIKTVNNQEKRKSDVEKLGISDIVLIGSEENPMECIDIYKPKVICLGYDQIGFSDQLDKYININNLNIKIIRIKPYKENIYKSSLIK